MQYPIYMKTLRKPLIFLLACLFIASSLKSQNDCASADVISSVPYFKSTTYSGMSNSYSGYCILNTYTNGADYVWKFEPGVSGCFTIAMLGQFNNTSLNVVSGCPSGTSTCIAYDDNQSGIKQVTFSYTIGDPIYIIADNSLSFSSATLELIVQDCSAGNTCSNAIEISGMPFLEYGSTCNKGNNYQLADYSTAFSSSDCNEVDDHTDGQDIVYKYIPQKNECLDVTLINTQTYDANLFIRSSCIDDTSPLVSTCIFSDENEFLSQEISGSIYVYEGEEVYFYIDSEAKPTVDCEGYLLSIQECVGVSLTQSSPTTPGNSCSEAPLICDISTFTGTINSKFTPDLSTQISSNFCGNGINVYNNSWIKFIATSNAMSFNGSYAYSRSTKVNTFGVGANRRGIDAVVYETSDCVSLTAKSNCVATNSTLDGGSFTLNASGLVVGTEYYIMLNGYNNSGSVYTLTSTNGVFYNPVTASGNTSICSGDTITLTANDGDNNYIWKIGASTIGTGATIDVFPTANTTYTVESAEGFMGCTSLSTASVNISVTEISVSASSSNPTCNSASNGSITVTASGGTSPYTYSLDGITYQSSNIFNGLSDGDYTVYAKDNSGCVNEFDVTLTEPTALALSATNTSPSCHGGNDGTIEANGSGGTPSLTYSIDGTNFQNTTTFTGISAGNYTVTLKDGNGCTTTTSTTVSEPDTLTFTTSETHVLCNGDNTGSTVITPNGGTAPYTYDLDNNGFQSSNSFTDLAAGTYTVTVKDDNNCTSSQVISISQPTAIGMTSDIQDITCNGNPNGEIELTGNGGTSPYTYSLDDVTYQSGNTFTGLSDGSYTGYVKDNNGCKTSAPLVVGSPSLINLTVTTDSVTCNGLSDGKIIVNATGGVGTLLAFVNGSLPLNLGTLINYPAGNYNVEVRDILGCSKVRVVDVEEPAPLAITTTKDDIPCEGGNDGEVTITPIGGNGAYEYSMDGSTWQASNSFTNLSPGTKTFYSRDFKGCTETESITIADGTSVDFTTTSTPASCNPDGTITVTVTNGQAPYSYELLGAAAPQVSNIFSGLSGGNYQVKVTDNKGCSATKSEMVGSVSGLAMSIDETHPTCFGSNTGTITINASGGTAPYTYSLNGGPYTTTNSYGSLVDNTYSVNVKDDNGCVITESVTLTEPTEIQISATTTPTSCHNTTDGSITLSATGGSGDYEYSIDNVTYTATNTFNSLGGGSITVYVKDDQDCYQQASFSIPTPNQLILSATTTDVSCFGGNDGEVTLSATGGTTPYNYQINGGISTSNPTFSGLQNGAFTFTVMDDNGCSNSSVVNVAQPTALGLTSNITHLLCFGDSDGEIEVNGDGGTPPYSYSINGGSFSSSNTFTGLTAGTYPVAVRDNNGCEFTEDLEVTSPSNLTAYSQIEDAKCNGNNNGTITINASGGTAPYSYQLNSNGYQASNVFTVASGHYFVTVRDNNGCTFILSNQFVDEPGILTATSTSKDITCNGANNGEITVIPQDGTMPYAYSINGSNFSNQNTFNNLAPGNYNIVVKDNNDCSINISVDIEEPTILSATYTTSDYNGYEVSCPTAADGYIYSAVTGGTPPYSYAWNTGETTDDNQNLATGNYSCTITDSNGCNTTINATLTAPLAKSIALVEQTNVSCEGNNDGSINIDVTNGVAPYQYTWSNGSTTQDLQNLSAGNYTVLVTDDNGCEATNDYTVTEPNTLQLLLTKQNTKCYNGNDGQITSTVFGGTAPYTYNWSHGSTQANALNLTASTYTLNVTDANGCQVSESSTITEPSEILLSTNHLDVSCNGGDDGSVNVNVQGGTPPYQYLWSNGKNSQDIVGLTVGAYTVTVTDVNGCSSNATESVFQPNVLSLNGTVEDIECNVRSTGNIYLTVTGGSSPYSYVWSNGATTANLSGLSAGIYAVEVTDGQGCQEQATYEVTEPSDIQVASVVNHVTCFSGSDGNIEVNVIGGALPYTYQWSNGSTSNDASNLEAGSYSVTIQDAQGCERVRKFSITEPTAITFNVTEYHNYCFGANEGSLDAAEVSGGTGNLSFAWNTGSNDTTIQQLYAGQYWLTVTDENSCSVSDTFNISEPQEIVLDTAIQNVSCYGESDGQIFTQASGGTGTLSVRAYDAQGNSYSVFENLKAQVYHFVVTDANGCTKELDAEVTQPEILSYDYKKTDVVCSVTETGSIELFPKGGTQPYNTVWNDDPTGNQRNNLGAGKYVFTVTDMNGCSIKDTIEILEASPIEIETTSLQDISCDGAATGAIEITTTGGQLPHSYEWNDGYVTTQRTNLTPGVYTIKIKDAFGCEDSVSYTIRQVDSPVFSINIEQPECDELEAIITTTPNQEGVISSSYDVDFTTVSDGTYQAEGSSFENVAFAITQNNEGCATTMRDTIVYKDSPLPNFYYYAEEPLTIFNTYIKLDNASSNAVEYHWDFGSAARQTSEASPTIQLPNNGAGVYNLCLTAIAENGCEATYCEEVSVADAETIYVPNAFTPGNDSKNEVFTPVSHGISEQGYEFTIYNRWGEQIFYSRTPNEGWDGTYRGTPVMEGKYVWKLVYRAPNTASTGVRNGEVLLLR